MSKILLVCSSFEENTLSKNYSNKEWVQNEIDKSHYPIGISYLHSYIENQGHEVKTLFLNTYSYEICYDEVKKAVSEFKPDIVGLQILTQNRVSSYHLIEYLRKHHPEIHLVVGGIHATAMYKQLIEKFPYLVIVIGEGELTFSELIKTLESKTTLEDIDGIVFSRNGQLIQTKPRPLIHDLDTLPFPKHELFFTPNRTHSCVLTTRGCPFRCSFCALEHITKRMHRKRSVKNVIEEIEFLKNKFPQMKTVWLHDDTFFLDNQRVIEFCNEVIKRKLNLELEFVASARIKPVCGEMVKKLEEANFVKVLFGLESGTDEILLRAHKNITQKDTIETFKLFAKTNIEITAFLIVGLPGETQETIYNTANFIKKLQRINYLYYNDIGVLMVYPGTEVCRFAVEAGQITDDFWLTDEFVPFYEVEHSKEKLFEFKKILLDHISLGRINTWSGFQKQWSMLPHIAKYLWGRRDKVAQKVGVGAHK
ncbi:MAG: radical SAM protein [Candidatus Micrarchaeota archaeon]